MKKLSIIIAALALSSAAFAQQSVKDSIAAAKALAKAEKAKKAEELKAFKLKQKEDLAAFMAKQNGVKAPEMVKPELKNDGDSVAYIFGIAQSNGLKQYMVTNLGVDTTYMDTFIKGIMDRVSIDPDNKELASYNAGGQVGGQVVGMAQQFSSEYYAADPDKSISATIVANGIVAGLTGQNDIPVEEATAQFRDILTKRQEANKEALYGANRTAGEKWLAENKEKPGVVTLPSGLQYKIITEGKGALPKATDKVKVNYEGTLIDGTVFDSSIQRGTPASFQVNQVIKGWTEALQKMPVGSKWELYIPYQLAYGERDTGKIKPYSALIFSVELLDIETK